MTVRELIEVLGTYDPELPVCYELYSEQAMLKAGYLKVEELQPPRNDGWVHDKRPDKEVMKYLVFPGN